MCFGRFWPRWRRGRGRSEEREPLLAQHHHDTALQRQLRQKLHTYQMLRALSKGFMPSNEQTVANLRALLASDVLSPADEHLSESGSALAHYARQLIGQLIQLLIHKNSGDQVQDFLWYLTKARVSVDADHVVERLSEAKARAETAAALRSFQTVGSLLLANSDFRLFLADLGTVAKGVFQDTALTLSDVSKEAGHRLGPSEEEQAALEGDAEPVARPELEDQAAQASDVLAQGALKVARDAGSSIANRTRGQERDVLAKRLQHAVARLRDRPDYSSSVSTLSLLLKRYALAYSHAAQDAAHALDDDVSRNPETDRALRNFYLFVASFGDAKEWEELEARFRTVQDKGRHDAEFDNLLCQMGNAIQEMLTDPAFFDHAEERFQDVRATARQIASDSSLREDIDGLLAQLQSTLQSVRRDRDIAAVLDTGAKIAKILWPAQQLANPDLVADLVHVFVPLLVRSVNYLPIPRLEISTPQLDLLLENLILEPGATINDSSFLPYKLRVETYNDVEVRKARFRTTSAVRTRVKIKIDGLSVRADEIGFWFRARPGLFRLADEGIASFMLDERGIDIEVELEVGKDRVETMLALSEVRVNIHRLDWRVRESKLTWLSWILKPILKPIVRKTMEMQMASAIADALHFANRELVYARERLRATRIAEPADLGTFIRAVLARLVPEQDPDVYTRLGVAEPGEGLFRGIYTPGSLVKLWNEEAAQAPARIRENEREGWRNLVFDIQASDLA